MTPERACEPAGWSNVRRFADERVALAAYEGVRDLLLSDDADASVFRFTLSGDSFIALVAETAPDEQSLSKFEDVLCLGEQAEAPPPVIEHLRERRRRFKDLGIDYLERRGRRS